MSEFQEFFESEESAPVQDYTIQDNPETRENGGVNVRNWWKDPELHISDRLGGVPIHSKTPKLPIGAKVEVLETFVDRMGVKWGKILVGPGDFGMIAIQSRDAINARTEDQVRQLSDDIRNGIKTVGPDPEIQANGGLNVRSTPQANSPEQYGRIYNIVDKIPQGTRVQVLEEGDEFDKVRYTKTDGTSAEGYVAKKFLE